MKRFFAITLVLMAISPFDPINTENADIAQKSCYTLVPRNSQNVKIRFKLMELIKGAE